MRLASPTRICAVVLRVCLLGACLGAAYNALSLRHLRQLAGVPGRLYDVDGYSMHMYCTGTGSPAILLSSGLGDDFTEWAKVQPVLSQQRRVCAYDRAGFGWSEPRSGVQDANAISSHLHQLIQVAGRSRARRLSTRPPMLSEAPLVKSRARMLRCVAVHAVTL
jgi:pimeloyl-ACP methyl ester carboxylesterase